MNKVVAHVQRLAAGKANVGYTVGSRYTGRREWHWDSRSGVYEELLPLVDVDAALIQAAFQKGLGRQHGKSWWRPEQKVVSLPKKV